MADSCIVIGTGALLTASSRGPNLGSASNDGDCCWAGVAGVTLTWGVASSEGISRGVGADLGGKGGGTEMGGVEAAIADGDVAGGSSAVSSTSDDGVGRAARMEGMVSRRPSRGGRGGGASSCIAGPSTGVVAADLRGGSGGGEDMAMPEGRLDFSAQASQYQTVVLGRTADYWCC